MKHKKTYLGLGSIIAMIIPVATILSCSHASNNDANKPTRTNTESNKETRTNTDTNKNTEQNKEPRTNRETNLEANKVMTPTEENQEKINNDFPTVEELKNASPEKLIKGLYSNGIELTHFLIVVGKDSKGFDVRTCFKLNGGIRDYTNRLVFNLVDKGEHDYFIDPSFDQTKIELGDLLTEEVENGNVITHTQDTHGKEFSYWLVKNKDLSFDSKANEVVTTTTGTQVDPVKTSPIEGDIFSGGVTTPDTIAELKKLVPGYYDELDNDATGQTLFNELRSIQAKYLTKVGSYDQLWSTYKDAFLDKYDEKDKTILDIYSENPNGVDPYNFIPGDDQDRGSHRNEGDTYNREHTIPQSVFGKTSPHIHNDAHFIFPTDSTVNGRRSNYPYDNVEDVKSIYRQGAKLGDGQNGGTSFEPIDAFKGDVARATLYFILTWKDTQWDKHTASYAPFGGIAIGGIKESYLKVYLEWDQLDQISQFDIDRNKAIAKHEGGLRNPFVDMPQLVNLIWARKGEPSKAIETPKVPEPSKAFETTKTPETHTIIESTDALVITNSTVITTTKTIKKTKEPKRSLLLLSSKQGEETKRERVQKATARIEETTNQGFDLSGIDINVATGRDFMHGMISYKKASGIVNAWSKIVANSNTIEEAITSIADAAYGHSDNNILNNVRKWLEKALAM